MNRLNNSSIMKEKEVFTGIDVCKLIASALIVLLHTIETSDFHANGVKFILTRFAVPFFFITSGYFFASGLNKSGDKKQYFLKYEINLIKIFAIWALVIYLPFTVSDYFRNNPDASTIKVVLLLFRRIFIIGPGPYWYLVALIWSTIFIFLCNIKFGHKTLVIVMLVGITFEIAYSCFFEYLTNIAIIEKMFRLIYTIYSWEFNFIMFGIPFTGIGYFICYKNFSFSLRKSCILFFVCTILRVFEYNLPVIFNNNDFLINNPISLTFIPQSIAFFMIAKEWKPKITKTLSLCLRQLSSFIYFLHAIILYNILDKVLPSIVTVNIFAPSFILPKWLMVIGCCFVIFCIIKKLNNKKLNILING